MILVHILETREAENKLIFMKKPISIEKTAFKVEFIFHFHVIN
jgi:hypothetical protein